MDTFDHPTHMQPSVAECQPECREFGPLGTDVHAAHIFVGLRAAVPIGSGFSTQKVNSFLLDQKPPFRQNKND